MKSAGYFTFFKKVSSDSFHAFFRSLCKRASHRSRTTRPSLPSLFATLSLSVTQARRHLCTGGANRVHSRRCAVVVRNGSSKKAPVRQTRFCAIRFDSIESAPVVTAGRTSEAMPCETIKMFSPKNCCSISYRNIPETTFRILITLAAGKRSSV